MLQTVSLKFRTGARSAPSPRQEAAPVPRADACMLAPDGGAATGGVVCHAVAKLNRELKRRTASLERSREARDNAATQLRRTESELRLVSAALMSSQEMERKRIAGELHDSIGQAVGTFGFGVGVALDLVRAGNTRAAEEMLMRVAAQAKQTVGEVRRIAMDLRPATLDDLGIVGTLSWFFREFRSVHPDLEVETEIDIADRDVPAALATAIFRVVQEACSNVVRHAGASEIQVTLGRRPNSIQLRVEDNGRGLTSGDCPGRQGMGLRSMRDRVEFSGGSFCMESEPGAGTCIVANWPISGAFCKTPEAGQPDDGAGGC